jgi:hypothetical protein
MRRSRAPPFPSFSRIGCPPRLRPAQDRAPPARGRPAQGLVDAMPGPVQGEMDPGYETGGYARVLLLISTHMREGWSRIILVRPSYSPISLFGRKSGHLSVPAYPCIDRRAQGRACAFSRVPPAALRGWDGRRRRGPSTPVLCREGGTGSGTHRRRLPHCRSLGSSPFILMPAEGRINSHPVGRGTPGTLIPRAWGFGLGTDETLLCTGRSRPH